MEIDLVWFVVILVLSCVIVGSVLYAYCLNAYNRKSTHYESVQEEHFKIPIETKDGTIELDAKILRSQYTLKPAPCVILCHGWTSDLNGLKYLQDPLTLQGYVVVAYSSRGHGKSGGKREFPAIYEDIIKVIDYLENNPNFGININRIAVIGHSMGGSIALTHAYLDKRVKVTVGISALHDVKKSLEQKRSVFSLAFWGRVWLRLTGVHFKMTPEANQFFSPKFYLSKPSNAKVFLIHAKNDPIVEFYNFEDNVAFLNLPAENTLVFNDGGHLLLHQECTIVSQLIKWLNIHL